jgi:diguanylate cyclase (GGDEF)-like protein
MEEAIRANDTVGRFGGDEFVLLLTGLKNIEEYQIVLQRLLLSVNEPIALSEDCEVKVGASIGVTLYPLDSNEPDILLRHADHAMYNAKQSGRNCICLFSE